MSTQHVAAMIVQSASRLDRSRREPSIVGEALLDAALTASMDGPKAPSKPRKPSRRARRNAVQAIHAMAPKAAIYDDEALTCEVWA